MEPNVEGSLVFFPASTLGAQSASPTDHPLRDQPPNQPSGRSDTIMGRLRHGRDMIDGSSDSSNPVHVGRLCVSTRRRPWSNCTNPQNVTSRPWFACR